MDERTRNEIDKVVWQTLRDAGITRPPVSAELVLQHLELHRQYYNLQDPGFLDYSKHKIVVMGRKLIDAVKKVKFKAVLFFDENRIVIDDTLPPVKHEWASLHESGHRILEWHRSYFYGDTAQTLHPDWHEALEAEANYAASALMFCGPMFSKIARQTHPEWETIKWVREHFGNKSFSTTLRRYVKHGPNCAMAMLVSTPKWKKKPEDQVTRCRDFVCSPKFLAEFPRVAGEQLMAHVDANARRRRGGMVADFTFGISDANGALHEFRAQTFFNTHYLQSLIFHQRQTTETRIFVPQTSQSNK